MDKMEITHLVKTDSLSKTQVSVINKMCFFCCHLRETYVKTKNNNKGFMETQCKS